MSNPNYVIVKLDNPVGPDDAQNLAQHIVQSIEFADVASARPAYRYPYAFVLFGEEVSMP